MSIGMEGDGPNPRVYSKADYDALAAECERLRLDNLSKNGSMKAFGEQIAALQRAVKNRDKLKARAEADLDAALAELAALKGGREAVATKWGHGVQGVPPYGFTCHADRRDQWIAEGKEVYVMDTAPPAQASAWVAGVEAVAKLIEKKADDYAMEYGHDDMGGLSFGSGQHAQAKADYHGSLIELAEEVRAMLAAAPTPGASDGKGDKPQEPHGHVTPRADGNKARCGGPSMCKHCQAEQRAVGKGDKP